MLFGLVVASIALARTAHAQQPEQAGAALAGVVRDANGSPLSDVEIVIRERRIGARSDSTGRFTLRAPDGRHVVSIRRLGFATESFAWNARRGEQVDVAVTLQRLAAHLDPVVVRAEEDARPAGRSNVAGVIVDDAGRPIPDVQVQLVGGTRVTATSDSGTFFFRGLAPGSYAIRARQVGYSPVLFHFKVADDDQRHVSLRMHALAQQLDPVQIMERSGFGRSQQAVEELNRRLQWRGSNALVLGPDDLVPRKKLSLDLLVRSSGGAALIEAGRSWRRDNRSIYGNTTFSLGENADDACILLNGVQARFEPLRLYSADQMQLLEVYAESAEHTGTLADRFASIPQCRSDLGRHPPYYVVWLRGATQ